MPELPEVQTIADDLNKKVLGRKIIKVWLDWPKLINLLENKRGVLKLIKKPALKDFEKIIKSKKILKVHRRAKNILIDLADDYMMLVHQKMTGHLLVGKWSIRKAQPSPRDSGARGIRKRPYEYEYGKERVVALEPQSIVSDPYNRFIHVIFYLSDGSMLALSDMRKFAKIILGKREDLENLPELKELGPEPLDPSFKVDKFISLISPKTGKIKQVLMDQKVISGIGNIYSDDILWLAKINPFQPADKISEVKFKELFKAIKTILNKAIKLRGSSISDFRDTSGKKGGYGNVMLAYQREGEKCFRNDGGIIIRKKIGGRSTCYCPVCQKI
ncbi:MAG: bifunctional DNA-formamidopyrimidine glycosylase/DNA-(apurinic or apyrimidinic site) lyase [Patescibacteria group bacterium]